MNEPEKPRFSALKTRLALVVVGLALGFAARWVTGWINQTQAPTHFEPMPQESAVTDQGSNE